jgi:two-component system sensor histidine kinase PilS (NtrC family)
MCLAIAIYLTTALKITVAAPLDILVTSLLLVSATVVTVASYWRTHFRRRLPGPTFLYLQSLFDVVLITAVVHMTGGAESDLASLYVLLIAVTAVLMPPANAGLVTLFAGLVYFADVFWGHSATVAPSVWVQLAVSVLVAVVTAYVASRVNGWVRSARRSRPRCGRCSRG